MIIASRSPRRASATPPAICADGSDGRSCSMLSLSQADRPVLGADLNRSESGQSFSGLDFQDFSSLYGKPYGRFASRCSSFGHGSLGQSTLVGGLGVADKLRKAGVAGDGPDLVRGAASLGQASGCGLSQSVRRAMRKPRLVTFAPEPMVMSEHLQLAAEMMCPDTSLHADETRRQVGQPCFYLPARPLLPQHDCTTFIVPHYVKRVLADIDTDHGDSRRVKSGPTSA